MNRDAHVAIYRTAVQQQYQHNATTALCSLCPCSSSLSRFTPTYTHAAVAAAAATAARSRARSRQRNSLCKAVLL
eukprot:19169-Heterococcus_DN1.PRE.1